MKAVILLAGEGRRLKPLTELRPKPMLPLANKPLVEYVVEALSKAGIDEIVLVVGYKRERIQSYFQDGVDWDIDIQYALQEKQLGTGHAILQAEDYIQEPFLVLNGDRVIEPQIIDQIVGEPMDDCVRMAITSSNHPSEYGVVEVENDTVVSITEKPPAFATSSDIINAGIYRFEPDIFEIIRETEVQGELTVTAALHHLIDSDRVRATPYDGIWLDVSFLWDLIEGNSAVLSGADDETQIAGKLHDTSVVADMVTIGNDTTIGPNSTILSGTSLGDNVRVGSNVVISNCVVLSDATIQSGAILNDCVIGENASVGANSTVEGGRADVVVEGSFHEDVRLGAVVGDNADIGGGVLFEPGSVVGTGTRVESGCTVHGRIDSETVVRRG